MTLPHDRSGDEWDVVLDEFFVQEGWAEAIAEERAARAAQAAQISRDHAREPSRIQRNAGIVVLLVALIAATFVVRDALGSPRSRTEAAAGVTTPATTAPTGGVTGPGIPLGAPAPAPAGEGGFRFSRRQDDGSGRPVAFDPCRELHYVVRPDNAPGHGRTILRAALAEVSRATGLVLVDHGTTGEPPSDYRLSHDPSRYGAGYSPVLIAWSDPTESPALAGNVAGFAGPLAVTGGAPGAMRYVSGQVVLDAPDFRRALDGRDGEALARGIVLHELGHLVGLGHVPDRKQLMFRWSGAGGTYAEGDLRGLNALGRGACFN